MSICIQGQWNAIVWTSPPVGWPHWRKQWDCDQLPDGRGNLRVSEHQPQQKPNGTSPPIRTISAAEQKTYFQLKFFWTGSKRKWTFTNDVIIAWGEGGIPWDVVLQERARNAFYNLTSSCSLKMKCQPKGLKNIHHWNLKSIRITFNCFILLFE